MPHGISSRQQQVLAGCVHSNAVASSLQGGLPALLHMRRVCGAAE